MLDTSRSLLTGALEAGNPAEGSPASVISRSMARIVRPFGPRHFETGCGFKVRGARFASAHAASVAIRIPDSEHRILSVEGVQSAANVLIQFDDGSGVVLPAIHGYVGAITVEKQAVVNVTWEPVQFSTRWAQVEAGIDELRSLRALLASSARLGVLNLRREDTRLLLDRIHAGSLIDPTLALYAAYALAGIQESEPILKILDSLSRELSIGLFDLALLAGKLRGRTAGSDQDLFPFSPLLAQGWALMRAHRVAPPSGLEALDGHRIESLWTLFDKQGVQLIRSALENKEIE